MGAPSLKRPEVGDKPTFLIIQGMCPFPLVSS
jgi:hypothetical protein